MAKTINYKSDFSLVWEFKDANGIALPIPAWDFDLRFYVSSYGRRFVVTQRGGVLTGAKASGNTLLVFVDNPGFSRGELLAEYKIMSVDGNYADGVYSEFRNYDTGVELVDGNGDADSVTVEAVTALYKGDKGEKGDTGPKGDKGEQGLKGDTGIQGPVGDTGIQGPKGDKGDKGLQGDTGPKGDKGEQGLKGDTGIQGPVGDTGIQGPKGDKGDKGEKGDTGPKGDTGEQGLKGDTGPKGDTGEQGLKGDTGEKGDKGLQGDTGKSIAVTRYQNGYLTLNEE